MLALIRFVFGMSSSIFPKLSSKLAFRLFCTPMKTRNRSAHHLAKLEVARKQFEPANYHSVPYAGGHVAAYEFVNNRQNQSESKTVFVIHGWQSNSLLMGSFLEPLISDGWRVVFIDLPGHGRSSGKTCHVPLAVAAVHAVSSHLGKCDAMITHSLGGAIAAATIAGTLKGWPPLPVTHLVTISSPCSVKKIFEDFYRQINLGKKAQQHFAQIVRDLSGRTADDFDVGKQLSVSKIRMLVIHAPDDKEIGLSEAESIVAQIPSAKLHLADGLGHRRIIASEEVATIAVGFLQSAGATPKTTNGQNVPDYSKS